MALDASVQTADGADDRDEKSFKRVEHTEDPSNSSKESFANHQPWRDYPFNLSTFNPSTEWGEHYEKIFEKDLWRKGSSFDLLNIKDGVINMISPQWHFLPGH